MTLPATDGILEKLQALLAYDEPPFRGAAPHAVDALRYEEVARGGEDEQQEIDAA